MTTRTEFTAPWGRDLKLASAFATTVLCLPVVIGLAAPGLPLPARVIVVLIGPLIVFGCLLFTVREYRLEESGLFVRRLCWETRVELHGLRGVERIQRADLGRGVIRVCGNGGLFSFTGWFWSKSMGRFRMFATDMDRLVLLTFAERKIVVSPDEPEAFVALVRKERRLPSG